MKYIPSIGDMLMRPKALSIVNHVGVAVGNDAVFHNTPERGEHVSSIAEFAAGKAVNAVSTGAEPMSVMTRVRRALSMPKKYCPVTRNCEHSVSDALSGKAKSPQLSALLAVVVVLAILAIIAGSE
jgi:hypothetical protein